MQRHFLPLRLFLATVAVLLFAGTALAQYSGQRVPLGILVTNWACDPCAPVNQVLDQYIPTMGNQVALIRVHCWWPGPDDPIYLASDTQSRWLVENTPTGSDFAPHMWLDNFVDAGSSAPNMIPAYQARLEVPAPLEIDVTCDLAAEQVTAQVTVLDPMPAGDYRLFVAVTEDNVFAPGPNDEDFHNQAFRKLYPDLDGIPIANELGLQEFTVETPLNFRWVDEEIRATVYVQNVGTGEIQNAGTRFWIEDATAAPTDLAATALGLEAYPNPFNPMTRIAFELPAAASATVRIHDLAGRVVRTLVDGSFAAGRHEIAWQGRDDAGRALASGMYVAQVRAGGQVTSTKLILAR